MLLEVCEASDNEGVKETYAGVSGVVYLFHKGSTTCLGRDRVRIPHKIDHLSWKRQSEDPTQANISCAILQEKTFKGLSNVKVQGI